MCNRRCRKLRSFCESVIIAEFYGSPIRKRAMWGCSHIETKFDGKFNSHEAILNDYPNIGDAIWGRFTEGTIWYYRKLSTIFNEVLPGRLARELSLSVSFFPTL